MLGIQLWQKQNKLQTSCFFSLIIFSSINVSYLYFLRIWLMFHFSFICRFNTSKQVQQNFLEVLVSVVAHRDPTHLIMEDLLIIWLLNFMVNLSKMAKSVATTGYWGGSNSCILNPLYKEAIMTIVNITQWQCNITKKINMYHCYLNLKVKKNRSFWLCPVWIFLRRVNLY